jgi:hypothetical protein
MQRSREPAPAVAQSDRSLEEHDADLYAGLLPDLMQELLTPPEFVLWAALLPLAGPGRDRVLHDGVAVWFD